MAQQVVGDGFVGEQIAPTVAVAAGFAKRLDEVLAGSLPGHLHQAQFGDLENVGSRLVLPKRVPEGPIGLLAMVGRLHVDEVDDDQPADIAKSQLIDDFLDGFEIGFVDRFFKIALAHEAPGVDVNGRQGFALIDDERSTGFEPDLALEVCVDLGFQPQLFEEGFEAFVSIDLGLGLGDEFIDEFLDGLKGFGLVDDDSLRIGTGSVPDDSERKIGLAMKDTGRGLLGMGELDRLPDGVQVPYIRLKVGFPHPVPGSADNEPQVLGPQSVDDFAQAPALFVRIDPARDTHSRRPGCEHQVSAGNRDVGSNPRTLGPDRGLGDLNDDLLAFGKNSINTRGWVVAPPALPAARAGILLAARVVEVVAHVEESGFFQADVDKCGLHSGQDPADAALDDVAHNAFPTLALDVHFGELGLFHQRDPGFPRVDVDNDFILH